MEIKGFPKSLASTRLQHERKGYRSPTTLVLIFLTSFFCLQVGWEMGRKGELLKCLFKKIFYYIFFKGIKW